MGIFKSKVKETPRCAATVQTGAQCSHPFGDLRCYSPVAPVNYSLYSALREAVPVIDSAVMKTVRLTGGFTVETGNDAVDKKLNDFLRRINVGANQTGIESFISTYLEQLLTFGTAVGEIVVNTKGDICALYNADISRLQVKPGKSPLEINFFVQNGFESQRVKYPELLLYSVLNPTPGSITGNSVLKGLPFVSDILMKIFNTIGVNWERLGNLRFAVTYKPNGDSGDRVYAKERAMQMAEQWSDAMNSRGAVKDFVAVGDVSVKVIGADNQILDSSVPVRQLLEQIVAKLGIPPFMLGLSWSSTERMSSQQADLLTSELEAYRRILEPVIKKIAAFYLAGMGLSSQCRVEWNDISLQDELELSRARLYNAQAAKIEKEIGQCSNKS